MYRRCWRCCGASERLLERRQGAVRIVLHKPSTEKYNDYILRAVGLLGYAAAFLLATHNSKYPVVLGLYSVRYALVLSGLLVVSTGLLVLSVPRWRARFAQGPARTVSRRQAWGLALAGWLALPLSFMLLRLVLPANDDRALTVSFLLMVEVAVMAGLLRWCGVGKHRLELRRLWLPVLGLVFVQMLIALYFHGSLPNYRLIDEIYVVGTAWKQAYEPSVFVNISADRNAQTWANFSLLWPLAGIYMRVFGVGWLQARAFFLFVLWGASPFIFGAARRLYGPAAALVAFSLAIAIPIHQNWALSHGYVATATSIALYAYMRAKQKGARQHVWHFACGFFALSAVEGHFYGLAFALVFALLQLRQFYVDWQQGIADARHPFRAYVLGNASFLIIWFAYHVALPGISLAEFPRIMRATFAWESALGDGFTLQIFWKSLQLYSFINPHEVLILMVGVAFAIRRRAAADRLLLFLFLGALGIIVLILAHINHYYFIFVMPFVCLFFGAGFAGRTRAIEKQTHGSASLFTIVGIFVIVCVLQLYAIQADESARQPDSIVRLKEQHEFVDIGRAIDKLLPQEEIVIAGDSGYYLGMPQRLNYWSTFSFTWALPKSWPLDPPQAIIVTLGGDEGYSGLADWLMEYDFRAVACYPVTSARSEARAAILYTLPELNSSVYAQNCSPEMLAWLDR